MIARRVRKPLVAMATAFAVCLIGIPLHGQTDAVARSRQDSLRTSLVLHGVPPELLAKAPLIGDLDAMRAALEVARNSRNPKIAQRAARSILLYDIATAKSSDERHALVSRLPVTIEHTPATAAGTGVRVRYIVNGKVKFERFVSTAAAATKPPAAEQPSGPSAVADDDCYDGPAPCATAQDMDDALVTLVSMQADLDEAQSEYDAGCAASPEDCGGGGGELSQVPLLTGGPYEPDSPAGPGRCAAEAGNAVGAIGGAVIAVGGTYLTVAGFIASGIAITAGMLVAIMAICFAAGFMAGYFLGAWVSCMMRITVPLVSDPNFVPAIN
jgi:hypothetical protein